MGTRQGMTREHRQDRTEPQPAGESLRTILTAAGANLVVAAAKGVAALITGSAALWAETAHSVADTGNELLLYVGFRRSRRREDPQHPFGYGRERFFWAFLAALGIFLVGGVLSVGEGVRSLLSHEPLVSPWVGLAVLAVSGGFEGYSWVVARRQLRADAANARRSPRQHLVLASDPSAPTVFLEDSAALVGIAVAMIALLLEIATGWEIFDGLASIVIGVLLVVVAFLLAQRTKALLVDEAAPPDVQQPIGDRIARAGWVARVRNLDAIFVGPGQLLVIASVVATPETAEQPARELVDRVAELRRQLLSETLITEVAITVEV
jgi:cation diffusion facilitator family transporter